MHTGDELGLAAREHVGTGCCVEAVEELVLVCVFQHAEQVADIANVAVSDGSLDACFFK